MPGIIEMRRIGSGSAAFLVSLLGHFQGNYPCTAAIIGLLHRQADIAFVPVSYRELSGLLGSRVSPRTLLRALLEIEYLGLIEAKTYPNTATRYHVNLTALRTLVASTDSLSNVVFGSATILNITLQHGALNSSFTLRHVEAISVAMSPVEFFAELLDLLDQSFPLTAVLFALLTRETFDDFVSITHRQLSLVLGECVSAPTTLRSLLTLESMGLIERDVVSKKHIRYRVDSAALRSLMAKPLAPGDVIPGLSPLPALERIFGADTQGDSLEPLAEGFVNG